MPVTRWKGCSESEQGHGGIEFNVPGLISDCLEGVEDQQAAARVTRVSCPDSVRDRWSSLSFALPLADPANSVGESDLSLGVAQIEELVGGAQNRAEGKRSTVVSVLTRFTLEKAEWNSGEDSPALPALDRRERDCPMT